MSSPAALTLEQGAAQLAAIVGPQHANPSAEIIVVSPADVQQIAAVLSFAHTNHLTVMPTGGATKLRWGNPVAPDIGLSMRRMSQLREHAWQDMTCTVQAGCPWTAMQKELHLHGQMVALDPLSPDISTVGGIVACNDSGALRLKFGGLRDLVIGMTIVLADGTIAKTGGKVVKNVAGYDLHKLMTGSFGTLGVIAEVNFRLHPLEEQARTWTATRSGASLNDAALFAEALRALMDSQITPSCVQLRASQQECALDIRIAAVPECLDEYAARLRKIFVEFAVAESEERVWQARQNIFNDPGAVVLKLSTLPSDICVLSSELQQWATSNQSEISIVAHATGLMNIGFSAAANSTTALVQTLRARVQSTGGSVIALQLPDSGQGAIDVWGPDRGTLQLMREIKRRFDPQRILNPGRLVGNI
jgi:glycolate oxidase FAD binding subunit